GATDQIAAAAHMPGRRHDEIAEDQISASLEALKPALVDQVAGELAEPKGGGVVAETRSGDDGAQRDIAKPGRIGVAAWQAEIDRPADRQAIQIVIPRVQRG